SKGLVEELIQLAKLNDPFQCLGVLILPEPTVLKRDLGVLSSGLIRVKAKTGIHQRLNFSIYFNATLRGSKISTDQFQERCLASSISSNDANPVTARNIQRDVGERCKLLGLLSRSQTQSLQAENIDQLIALTCIQLV